MRQPPGPAYRRQLYAEMHLWDDGTYSCCHGDQHFVLSCSSHFRGRQKTLTLPSGEPSAALIRLWAPRGPRVTLEMSPGGWGSWRVVVRMTFYHFGGGPCHVLGLLAGYGEGRRQEGCQLPTDIRLDVGPRAGGGSTWSIKGDDGGYCGSRPFPG